MAYINLDIVCAAYRKTNVIDETEVPSAEQGVVGVSLMNDLLMEFDAEGVRLGYYPQTNLADPSPLRDEDVRAVKLCLAAEFASEFGLPVSEVLAAEVDQAYTGLVKRSIRIVQSSSELPFAQGSWYGNRS